MQLKDISLLCGLIMFLLVISSIQMYNTNTRITALETTIIEQQTTIEQLTNDNIIAKENCSEIVKGYVLVINDINSIITNLNEYTTKPERLILDMSISMSRAERFMEKKNELLTEMDINVAILRSEINEIIKMK